MAEKPIIEVQGLTKRFKGLTKRFKGLTRA